MFSPLSRSRLYYEVILLVTVVASGFLIPVGVGWAPDLGQGWRIFFVVTDVYFMLDTILNFRLGYIVSYTSIRREIGGLLPMATAVEMNPRKVARHYLKTWFVPDTLGSLPFDLVGWRTHNAASGLKLLGLLRLFKVMRLNYLQSIFRWRPTGFMFAVREVIFTFLWMYLFCHFSACVFFWVGRLQPPNPEGAWIYSTNVVVDGNEAVPVSEANGWQQYITSLYFSFVAMTSVGFGDIHAGNTVQERVWVTVEVAVGAFVLGFVIAKMTSLMLEAHKKNRQALLRSAALQDFFDAQAAVPDWLRHRIITHFDNKWCSKETEALQGEIIDTMPRPLRLELSVEWWMAKVKPSVLLPHDRAFLRSLLAHAEVHDIKPMETILEQGSSRGTGHLYVICSGVVVCTRDVRSAEGSWRQNNASAHRRKTKPRLEHLATLSGLTIRSGAEGNNLTLRNLPIDLEEDADDDGDVSDEVNGCFGDHDLSPPSARSRGGGSPSLSRPASLHRRLSSMDVPPFIAECPVTDSGGEMTTSSAASMGADASLMSASSWGGDHTIWGGGRTSSERSMLAGGQGLERAGQALSGRFARSGSEVGAPLMTTGSHGPAEARGGWPAAGLGVDPPRQVMFATPDPQCERERSEGSGGLEMGEPPAGEDAHHPGRVQTGAKGIGSGTGERDLAPAHDRHEAQPRQEVQTWELSEGALVGESVLQSFLDSKLDIHHSFVHQVREGGRRIRQRSAFTARSRTAVRLNVIAMEDVLETIESFTSLFMPLITAVQQRRPRLSRNHHVHS
eukprot:jgi/Mesvir1/9878/Mv22409-RA.1